MCASHDANHPNHRCKHHSPALLTPMHNWDNAPLHPLRMVVNGVEMNVSVPASARLLDVIRDYLRLTGTKEGCGVGECGACTVIADDQAILSCMTPALSMQDAHITTIEGLADGDNLHPMQLAFIKHTALQCGFCTPAMILVGVNLLKRNPKATRDDIKLAISGTLCRCTGYEQIIDAIEEVRG